MLELTDKDIKAAIINMFGEVKEYYSWRVKGKHENRKSKGINVQKDVKLTKHYLKTWRKQTLKICGMI